METPALGCRAAQENCGAPVVASYRFGAVVHAEPATRYSERPAQISPSLTTLLCCDAKSCGAASNYREVQAPGVSGLLQRPTRYEPTIRFRHGSPLR